MLTRAELDTHLKEFNESRKQQLVDEIKDAIRVGYINGQMTAAVYVPKNLSCLSEISTELQDAGIVISTEQVSTKLDQWNLDFTNIK